MVGGVVPEVKFPYLVASLSLIDGKLTLELYRRADFPPWISLTEQLPRRTPLPVDRTTRCRSIFRRKIISYNDHGSCIRSAEIDSTEINARALASIGKIMQEASWNSAKMLFAILLPTTFYSFSAIYRIIKFMRFHWIHYDLWTGIPALARSRTVIATSV